MSLHRKTATELLALQAGGQASRRRDRRRLPRRDRDREPKLKAFMLVRRGRGPRAGRRDRREAQGRASRSGSSPACRSRSRTCSARRASDHLLQQDPGELRPALRRPRRRAAEGRGRGPHRQDEHGRVRDGLVHREQRLPGHAQPVGHSTASPAARRGGSAAAVAACQAPLVARHRHRRLDPPAGRRCAASSA